MKRIKDAIERKLCEKEKKWKDMEIITPEMEREEIRRLITARCMTYDTYRIIEPLLARMEKNLENVAIISSLLKDSFSPVKINAGMALLIGCQIGINIEKAMPDVVEALEDKEPRVRSIAASIIREMAIKGYKAKKWLLETLKAYAQYDPDKDVQLSCAMALRAIELQKEGNNYG
ncbi:MAG: HEAT repeat domain-containing protein [Candidatus Anstonellales archaeon]